MAQIAACVPAHRCLNALVTRARGLQPGRDEKVDALVIVAWTDGMIEPAVFTQGYSPAAKEGFSLLNQPKAHFIRAGSDVTPSLIGPAQAKPVLVVDPRINCPLRCRIQRRTLQRDAWNAVTRENFGVGSVGDDVVQGRYQAGPQR